MHKKDTSKDRDKRDNNNNNINNVIFIIIIIIIQILLLITKLTIKSYLKLISLKKLFSQSTIYNSFRLKKRRLISIEKIHSIKNIRIRKKLLFIIIIDYIIIIIIIIIIVIITIIITKTNV